MFNKVRCSDDSVEPTVANWAGAPGSAESPQTLSGEEEEEGKASAPSPHTPCVLHCKVGDTVTWMCPIVCPGPPVHGRSGDLCPWPLQRWALMELCRLERETPATQGLL